MATSSLSRLRGEVDIGGDGDDDEFEGRTGARKGDATRKTARLSDRRASACDQQINENNSPWLEMDALFNF